MLLYQLFEMKKEEVNRIIQASLIFGFVLLLSYAYFCKVGLFSFETLKFIPSTLGIITFSWGLYFSFLWKWKFFRHILYKENLNGTWLGTYTSTNFTTNEQYKGKIAIVIRQKFLNVNVQSFTENYINYSFGEAVKYHSESELLELIYLYSQSPLNPTDDRIRKGTSELKLQIELGEYKLFGDFWTNHNSKGSLEFERTSKKHCTSYKEANKLCNK